MSFTYKDSGGITREHKSEGAGTSLDPDRAYAVIDTAAGAGVTIGLTNDVRVEGDTAGTISAKLRGIATAIGALSDGALISDAAGSLNGRLRGLMILLGTASDAKVEGDVSGSVAAKLRGLSHWAFTRMPGSLGQKAMSGSLPVVVASDQAPVPMQLKRTASLFGADATLVGATPTLVRASNPARHYILIQNKSTQPVALWGAASTATNAFAGGKSFAILPQYASWESYIYTGDVYAIVASGSAYVSFMEHLIT